MKLFTAATLGLLLSAGGASAEAHATGDAEKGENVFRKCKACHAVIDNDDEAIQKGGKTGPNLYGLFDRKAGSVEGFRYGASLVEAGEKGLVWTEADFVGYVADPRKFLQTYLEDTKAKSKMGFKLKDAEDATDLWAYLVSVGPEVGATAKE
ncbi:cytochrome c [Sulfitobacter brevis]|uniref:Cytochrome c n=1 Tax=Sulfitobacter brevis TaxID=74348 RepID=A0A1I1Y2R7_9RHOB|nr:c-type cytochrome [Sulfitobacter brevis]SFE13699.1 cytochrome c [Sulfitobacter brevis]